MIIIHLGQCYVYLPSIQEISFTFLDFCQGGIALLKLTHEPDLSTTQCTKIHTALQSTLVTKIAVSSNIFK